MGVVRVVVGVVGAVALVVGVLVTLLWQFQRDLIYLPSSTAVASAATVFEGGQDVEVVTTDGLRLGGWLVPPRGRDRAVAVLMAPGNAGDRSLRAPLARALADRGLTVLLFDYRGYGGNTGRPSESALALDVRAAHRYLVEEVGIPTNRQVYLGESLGAAVVTELATVHPPGGVVLRSPFADLASVGERHYPFLPVRRLLWDRFPVTEHVARVTVPVTVVYGTGDRIVPPEQSLAVADSAGGPARVVAVEGADHNDPALLDGSPVVEAVVAAAAGIRR
jgi:pimeloyl-ACP methyl ester carboxylesterase